VVIGHLRPLLECEQVTRRTLRYGASIVVALVGVACGALIPGTAGGTAATVLVGIGLVGVVSLIFYEVGLTEDRDREADARRRSAVEREQRPPLEPGANRAPGATHEPGEPSGPGAPRRHQDGRARRLDRRRGQRRRLR
jgi:hypothetical protein